MFERRKNKEFAMKPKVVAILVLFSVSVMAWHLIRPGLNELMPVENVRIDSTFKNLPLTVLRQKIVGVLSGGYFTVDIDLIRNELLELPWVEDVSVRRKWPSGLHVRVIEKQAVAFWGDSALLSDRGEVFTPEIIDHLQNLPYLEGPEGLHENIWEFKKFVDLEIASMGVAVKKMVLDERRAWSFTIANELLQHNIEIRLGKKNITHRLTRFVKVFSNHAEKLAEVEYVDLRYPNGFALRLKNNNVNAINQNYEDIHARKRGVTT